MYAIKNEDDDRMFLDRASQIKRIRPSEIMTYLGIKDKFIIGGGSASSEKSRVFSLQLEQSQLAYSSNQRFSVMPINSKEGDLSNYESHRSADLNPLSSVGGDTQYIFNNSSTSSSLG